MRSFNCSIVKTQFRRRAGLGSSARGKRVSEKPWEAGTKYGKDSEFTITHMASGWTNLILDLSLWRISSQKCLSILVPHQDVDPSSAAPSYSLGTSSGKNTTWEISTCWISICCRRRTSGKTWSTQWGTSCHWGSSRSQHRQTQHIESSGSKTP